MTAEMSDAQRRLLQAVLERVPIERVAEVHLFPSMRQGVVETGIAVVAAERTRVSASGEQCDPTDDAAGASPSTEPDRHTVLTARYRHTIKGPDRGKWETSVVEEADAPLVTVEAVVRGVQRRANEDGDAAEAERLSNEDLRAMIESPAWPPPPVMAPGAGARKSR